MIKKICVLHLCVALSSVYAMEPFTEQAIQLQESGSIDTRDEQGHTKLHRVILAQPDDHAAPFVSSLLSVGARVNTCDKAGCTPLHSAVERGASVIVDLLLSAGASTQARDTNDMMPLHYAVQAGRLECVKRLVARDKAVLSMPNKQGLLPIQIAILANHYDVASYLFSQDQTPVMDAQDRTLLHYMVVPRTNSLPAKQHDAEKMHFIQMLFARNIDINGVEKSESNTALHYAAMCGDTDVVEALLEHQAQVDLRNKALATPLTLAARYGKSEIVNKLIEARAQVVADKLNRTPLHYAAESGHASIVHALLAYAPQCVNSSDKSGKTPLSLAVCKRKYSSVSALLAGKADQFLCDKQQRIPLHHAAASLDMGLIKTLLANSLVGVKVQDQEHKTPYEYAVLQTKPSAEIDAELRKLLVIANS